MPANGRYVKIATRFWTDEKVIDMDPETKLLYLYCLSSPHSNMAGFYRLPKAYIQADLGISKEQLDKGFNKLLDKGLVKYCSDTSVILIINYFKYNTIQNKNQAKGAANRTSELPKNSLMKDYLEAVRAYAPNYEEELMEGLPKGFTKGFANTDTDTDTELDTDTDTDTESCFQNFYKNNSEEFKSFMQQMSKGVILNACKLSVDKKNPVAYCKGILKNWQEDGIESVRQLNSNCDYKYSDHFIEDWDKYKE